MLQPLLDVFLRPITSAVFERGLFYVVTIPGNGSVTINPFVTTDVTGQLLPANMAPLITAAPPPTAPPCYIFFNLTPFALPPGANGGLVSLNNPVAANTPDGQFLLATSIDLVNDNAMAITILFQLYSVRPFGT